MSIGNKDFPINKLPDANILYQMESDFAEWLQEELDKRGWSQADIARRASISNAQISRVASGLRQPGNDLCIAIAQAFGYSAEYVFRIAGLLPPKPEETRSPTLLEMIEIFRNSTPEEQEEMISFARWRVQRAKEERERAKRRRPGSEGA